MSHTSTTLPWLLWSLPWLALLPPCRPLKLLPLLLPPPLSLLLLPLLSSLLPLLSQLLPPSLLLWLLVWLLPPLVCLARRWPGQLLRALPELLESVWLIMPEMDARPKSPSNTRTLPGSPAGPQPSPPLLLLRVLAAGCSGAVGTTKMLDGLTARHGRDTRGLCGVDHCGLHGACERAQCTLQLQKEAREGLTVSVEQARCVDVAQAHQDLAEYGLLNCMKHATACAAAPAVLAVARMAGR